jgi:PAS domain S-box-containing protein
MSSLFGECAREGEDSDRWYKTLFENVPIGIYRTTPDGRILVANPTLVRMLGYTSSEELVQHNLEDDRFEPEYPRSVFKNRLEFEGEVTGLESAWKRRDGTFLFIRENARAIRDDSGTILYYEGTVEDITERKKAEEESQKSEERFRVLIRNSSDIVYVLDSRGFIQYVSPNVSQVLGYSDTVPADDRLNVLSFVHPDDSERAQKALVELKKNPDKTLVYEFRIRDMAGSYIWAEVWCKNLLDDPYVSGFVLNVRNITDRKKAEEQLRESEEKYRNIVELAPDGIVIMDLKGFITSCNTAFLKLTGYTEEDVVNKHFSKLPTVRLRDIPRYMKIINSLLRGRVSSPIEFTWVHKDGATRLGEVHASLMRRGIQIIGIQAVARDITDRKKAEELLKFSEEKYRSLVENLNVGVYRVMPVGEGQIIDVNRALVKMLGYEKKEDILKLKISDTYYNPGAGADILNKISKQGFLKKEEIVLKKKDGTPIIVSNTGKALYKDGKLLYFDGILEDITERKKVEEELEQYRHHLEELVKERTTALTEANVQLQEEIKERKLIEESLAAEKEQLAVTLRSIGDGVITTDTEGSIVLINKAAEALTGYTQEEAMGKLLSTVFYIVNEQTRRPCENPVDKVLLQGAVVGLGNNTVLISRDGTERVIADSGAPIRDHMSRIIGVVLVFRDITEKRRMEQELLRTQKLESLGNLAGGIAHDFNNILTAVVNTVALAKMNTTDNKMEAMLTKIEKASLQARNLTQQLLTFSKGGAPIKKATSLKELIRDSASFALRGSNVRCHFYIPDDLSPADIDEGQISQVINNLIMNADEAMPEGGVIQVKAENVFIDEGVLPLRKGDYVKISIKDGGVGISEKYLQKIFDPYFTTKQKGSGLGLSTSYSVIMKHEGYITAESDVGTGTTFYIYLPASQKVREEQEEGGALVKGKGRVLLMDDEEIVRDAADEVLTYLGYTVETVADGEEVIDVYTEALKSGEPFDIVIMDLTIPGGMGGKEAITTLLQVDPHVKAIVASGYSTDPVMADYKKYGFKGMVTKPYTIEDLSRALHKVMT